MGVGSWRIWKNNSDADRMTLAKRGNARIQKHRKALEVIHTPKDWAGLRACLAHPYRHAVSEKICRRSRYLEFDFHDPVSRCKREAGPEPALHVDISEKYADGGEVGDAPFVKVYLALIVYVCSCSRTHRLQSPTICPRAR